MTAICGHRCDEIHADRLAGGLHCRRLMPSAAFTGCEHCGYVRRKLTDERSEVDAGSGECPECGRPLAQLDHAEAMALLGERREADRFRAQAAADAAARRAVPAAVTS
jgi:hypothetical protein